MIVGKRSCLVRGMIDINDFSHCGNKECVACNRQSKAFKEGAKEFLLKIKEGEFPESLDVTVEHPKYVMGFDDYKEDSGDSKGILYKVIGGIWEQMSQDYMRPYNIDEILKDLNEESPL